MFNKKIIAIGLLAGSVLLASMTTLQQLPPQQAPGQQPRPEPKVTNLKVLPKSLKYQQVDHIMDEWAKSLGVRCNFCHSNNPTTKRIEYSLDGKPEKEMARKMFAMESKLNKKYFGAKKDSLGLMAHTGINCNTCHKGVSHPKVVYANVPRVGGAPGPGGFGPGGPGQGAPGAPPRQQIMGTPATTPPATPPTNR
jgi:hypothetical protein